MSRTKSRLAEKPKNKKLNHKAALPLPLSARLIARVLDLPRVARIGLCAIFALAVTFALFPLVDYLYLRYLFTMETRVLPAIVSAGFGLVIYMLGWWLIVGMRGEKPPARLLILWYVGAGTAAVIFVIILAVFGISIANIPTTVAWRIQ